MLLLLHSLALISHFYIFGLQSTKIEQPALLVRLERLYSRSIEPVFQSRSTTLSKSMNLYAQNEQ
jgi:hypothetical protein